MPSTQTEIFNEHCRACPRLSTFLDSVKAQHPQYWCKPVPPFGVNKPQLVVVGLAPGMHGANASGRPFTGDWCGPLLYSSLHQYGFASKPESIARDDDLQLINARLSNAVKCLPPDNKVTLTEIKTCNHFLKAELENVRARAILALGTVAHQAVLLALGHKPSAFKFGHGAQHAVAPNTLLFDSYHVSRYNTNTKRLTPAMFHQVLANIQAHLQLL